MCDLSKRTHDKQGRCSLSLAVASIMASTVSSPDALLSLVGHGEAPGRLDFMGGVADYSGSLVLEMPIRSDGRCIHTLAAGTAARCHRSLIDCR